MSNITAMIQLSTTKKMDGEVKKEKFSVFQLDTGYMIVESSYDSRYDYEFMDYFSCAESMDAVNRMIQNWLRVNLEGYFASHDYQMRSKRAGEYPEIYYEEQTGEKNAKKMRLKFRKDVSAAQMNEFEWTLRERMNEVLASDEDSLETVAV